jgi:UDP-glucose 4-epimerase
MIKNNKRVIITGNKGYIAHNLEKFLINKGYIVGGFDVKDGIDASVFSLPKKHNVDTIIHLAGIAGIKQCESNVNTTVKNNIISSSNIFQQAANHNVQVIFASSQAAKKPDSSVYASTKRYAECYANYFNNNLNGKIRILRLCNVYGGEKYLEEKDSVVARFIRAKKENTPAIVHGDGTQTRDFIHIDDVCNAIYLAMNNPREFDEIIDIGTGVETSILRLAELIGCDYTFQPSSNNIGVKRNPINMKKSEELFGYYPNTPLEEGIKKEIN